MNDTLEADQLVKGLELARGAGLLRGIWQLDGVGE
mgnify:CR=1 FL=1